MNTSYTVKKRISIGFAMVITITALVGAVGIFSLWTVNKLNTQLATSDMPGALIMATIKDDTTQAYALIEKHVRSTDMAEMQEVEDNYEKLYKFNTEQFAAYDKTILKEENRQLLNNLLSTAKSYATARKEIIRLSHNGEKAKANAFMHDVFQPEYNNYRASVEELMKWNRDNATQTAAETGQKVHTAISIISFSIAGAMALAIFSAFLIVRRTNQVLFKAITSLKEGSTQLSAASFEVSEASNSLAQGASEQAASIEETSASLEEMSSMTASNAQSARQAKGIAEDMRKAADESTQHMREMEQAMDAIKDSSAGISQIIKTIDEIAFQTNILALNAAVEAARAGEAGAVFAIVAEEVRNLAQRSANSAKETSSKIEGALRSSERGVQISAKVAGSLGGIVGKARDMNAIVSEIATATDEQNKGIRELSEAVTQMDKVTQGNASSAEETAAASQELNGNAASLNDTVHELMSLVQKSVESANQAASRQHSLIGLGEPEPERPSLPQHSEGEKDGKHRKLLMKGGSSHDKTFKAGK